MITYTLNSYSAEWAKEHCEGSSEDAKTPNSNDSANGTISDKIIEALSLHGTAYFQIQDNFTFSTVSGKEGIGDIDGGDVTADIETNKAKNMIINGYKFTSLRIENGVVSTDDTSLKCTADILPDKSGVTISMKGDAGFISGTIKGNELVGDASFGISSYVYNVGRFATAYGMFSVSLKEVQASDFPPKPVYITSIRMTDKYEPITLRWKDPNPAGVVSSYAIYRKDLMDEYYEKIINVKDCNSWTDDSDYVLSADLVCIEYMIVVEGVNGKPSEQSNNVWINIM